MARRVLHDRYFKQAKRDGYLARSAYKLTEIDDRKRILSPGMRVLDLGCAPGSWLQVLAERVGPRGKVVGIDLQPVRGDFGPRVHTIAGDFTTTDPADLTGPAGGLFRAVVSDMAPNTSGHGDDFRSAELVREVIAALPGLLAPKGHLVVKIFEGAELQAVVSEARQVFGEARAFKPAACREMSRETYIVAKGYRPPTQPSAPDAAEPEGEGPDAIAKEAPPPAPGWGAS